jgi:hypothetical protein
MNIPDLMYLSEYSGNWKWYIDAIYNIYLADIVNGEPALRGARVAYRRHPESFGKGAGFWHVVSEGKQEDERTPDLRRCERIRWIRYVIDNVDHDSEITWWRNTRGSDTNTLLWLREEYVVILSSRAGYHLLRTAFCTDQAHRVDKFRRERNAWIQAQMG